MASSVEKPRTIPEAVAALRQLLPADQIDVIRRSTRDDLVRFHFNLGSYIRNLWVHRGGSPLVTRARAAGARVGDGDAISQLILEALWADLNDQSFDLTGSSSFRALASADDAPELASALMSNG